MLQPVMKLVRECLGMPGWRFLAIWVIGVLLALGYLVRGLALWSRWKEAR